MAGAVLVGTSGWHYPGGNGTWNGPFYPLKRSRGFDELRFYAERFDTVEVNATFYRQPDPGMSRKWLERTPSSFLFSVKLFQKFTHPDMYLARPDAAGRAPTRPRPADWDVTAGDIDIFRAGLHPLAAAGRLGALLIQFPSSFHATPDAREYVSWLLRAFGDYPRAVEFRHKSWTETGADTIARIEDAGAALVRIDEPFAHLEGARVSGHQGVKVLGAQGAKVPLAYIRLHGRNKAQWWEHEQAEDRYNYLYTEAELRPIADEATEAAALEKRVLVYFNNHFSAKAVASADILKNQLGQVAPAWRLRP